MCLSPEFSMMGCTASGIERLFPRIHTSRYDNRRMRRVEELLSGRSTSLSSILMRAGLWCLSQPYSAVIWGRNLAYDRRWKKVSKTTVPVVSVGNLTAGGTGKTPTVAMLARWFRERNIRVGILSRGFGAGIDGRNDEAKELEVLLPDVPHLQKPDRLASAQIATEELGMQLLLLDDGFQHRKIHRDLEIILLDAREPFGFGHLLPRGLLREPLRSSSPCGYCHGNSCRPSGSAKASGNSDTSSTLQSESGVD